MSKLRDQALEGGVVIVGAGQAGGRAAETLRRQGFTGRITLIGDEAERPYERPSLSKEMLLDPSCETIAWLHGPEFYAAQNIDLKLGIAATAIDPQARRVMLSDGSSVDYGVLLLTTGAQVRRLDVPGAGDRCHYIRSLEDSRALRGKLVAGKRVVVIGAGFIGLEVAAAAITRGCEVVVIEAADGPLGRVAPAMLRDYYRALHAARGVTFRFGAQVVGIAPRGDGYVVITNGDEAWPADIVVAGIGVIPNSRLAEEAGLACDRGILVDEYGATADPRIFAAGDVARHHNPLLDRSVLLESWQNAQNQAIAIARNIASDGEQTPYAELPWFWSDQYGINLQIYGLLEDGGEFVVRGDPASESWLIVQLVGGRIVFAAGINAARDLRPLRELMKLRALVAAADIADTKAALPELLRRARAGVAAA
jgi:NADPH-dependent 2,4-dienoyl-CoA reductase/sulfur reductase-like enzyme